MFGGGTKETLHSSIQLEALELSAPLDKNKFKTDKVFVTMVIKRGEQQRHETVNEKLEYQPLGQDETELEENERVYQRVCANLGWNDKSNVDPGTDRYCRSIEENNVSKVIDYARY